MKTVANLTSFNSGEFSPLMGGRVDLKNYVSGCQKLRNFIPKVQGPVTRRPGTRFVAEVKDSTKRVWSVPFKFDRDQAYVMEFGDRYIRFFANHAQVVTGAVPVPYEIVSPYLIQNLTNPDGTFALRMAQAGDVIYIAHGLYPPQKLTRTGSATFTIGAMPLDDGPFEDVDLSTPFMIQADGVSGGINLTATNTGVLEPNLLDLSLLNDTLLYLEQEGVDNIKMWEPNKTIPLNDLRRSDGKTYKAISTGNLCTIVNADTGNNRVTSSLDHNMVVGDAWIGAGALPAPLVAGVTYFVKTIPSTKELSLAATLGGAEIVLTTTTTGGTFSGRGKTGTVKPTHAHDWRVPPPREAKFDGDPGVQWEFQDPGYGWVRILAVNGGGVTATAGVISRLPIGVVGINTHRWARQSWNGGDGWPTSVMIHGDRLWMFRGRRAWASVSGDFESFQRRDAGGLVTADMSISIDTTSSNSDAIVWAAPSGDAIIIGTGGDEHALRKTVDSEAFGPGNVTVEKQSDYGSRSIAPAVVGDGILFVQKSGRKVWDMKVAQSIQVQWVSNDITVLAEHITRSGIIAMAYQQEPDAVLWCVRADGELIGFTLNREQEVRGWHPHRIGGKSTPEGHEFAAVESISVIPAPGGGRDEVWMIVRRYVNGQIKRYVEFMEARHEEEDDPHNAFYTDAGLSLYSGRDATVTPLLGATIKGQTRVRFVADRIAFFSFDLGKLITHRYYERDASGKKVWKSAVAKITRIVALTDVEATILEPWPVASQGAPGRVIATECGSGYAYNAPPALTVIGGFGRGATLQAHMQVVGCTPSAAGAGYVAGELATVFGGTFTRPAILRLFTAAGAVTGYEVVDGGDYTVLPGVAGVSGGTAATGPVTFAVLSAGGLATVFLHWGMLRAEVTNQGEAYISQPLVTVDAAPFVGTQPATVGVFLSAFADYSDSKVVHTEFGPGYSYNGVPLLTVNPVDGGTGAVLQAHMQVLAAEVNALGAGYTAGDFITVQGGVFTRPAILRVIQSGGLAFYEVFDGGDYTQLPGIPAVVNGVACTRAVQIAGSTGVGAQVDLYWGLAQAEIVDGGAGYKRAPTVTVDGASFAGPHVGVVSAFIAGSVKEGNPITAAAAMLSGDWQLSVTVISGLGHLEGQVVDVCGDGAAHRQLQVVDGAIELDEPCSIIHIGLPCPAVMQPMPLETPSAEGTSRGQRKRVTRAILRFHETAGCKYGRDEDPQLLDSVLSRDSSNLMDEAVPLFSGDVEVSWPDGYDGEAIMSIVQDQPLPCTVVSITPDVEGNRP